MDRQKAIEYYNRFKETSFENFQITELLGFGKSGVVLAANGRNRTVALKIIDEALVKSFGLEIQEQRLKRELTLKDHSFPNLVEIIDGGVVELGSSRYLYIVMPLIVGKNLKQFFDSKGTVDEAFAKEIFRVLFATTEALLAKNYVHRDIKPENIMIDDNGKITLMDLGVLKVMNNSSLTDESTKKPFLATLRYAPPELLFREEEDNVDSWRAINLYQIGGVLHDAIMGKELFHQYSEPYTKLVLAIKDEVPAITRLDFSPRFLQFVRDLLAKAPKDRLQKFKTSDFENLFKQTIPLSTVSNLQKLKTITSTASAEIEAMTRRAAEATELKKKRKATRDEVVAAINKGFERVLSYQIISSVDLIGVENVEQINGEYLFYQLNGGLKLGFSAPVYIIISMVISDDFIVTLQLIGIAHFTLHNSKQYAEISTPLAGQKGKMVFDSSFDSVVIETAFERDLIAFITKAVEIMAPFVQKEIEYLKSIEGKKGPLVRTLPNRKPIAISEF